MAQSSGGFWDSVRAWADSAGLTVAAAQGEGSASRPAVPDSVCANCPICQGAATLEQINPVLIDDLATLAHSLLGGIGSALAVAAEQRRRLAEHQPSPHDSGPSDTASERKGAPPPHMQV